VSGLRGVEGRGKAANPDETALGGAGDSTMI